MDKINRVIYKGIVACVVAVGIANVVDYFYAALHASAATSGSANFKPSVVINPTATITLSNSSASLAVTPNKNGMFAYTQTPIRVDARTNTPNDVAVNMVPSGSANTLVSGSNSIATLDTTNCATGCATTSSNFLNRWGYNVTTSLSAPSTYLPVLTTANQVLAYNNTAANISNSTATTRYVYFGMKVDQSTAPGTYSRALNFTVTVAPDPEPEVPTMQNATSSSLASLLPNVGDTDTLVDSRDGNAYAIAKLADGHYWMTQNLRLGKGNGEEIVLTSSDSNVSSDFTLKASGMGSSSPDATGDCNVGDWYPSSTSEYLDKSHLCINTTDTEKYGVYYNWYTATAGTGTYSMGEGDNASGSICPKGWILPPNEGDRSYYNLLTIKLGLSGSTGSTTMQNAPYNFPLSGDTYGAGIRNVGTYGGFWLSSAANNTMVRVLHFDSSSIYPQNNLSKGNGGSVRCVFDDRPTMQNADSDTLAELMPNTGDTTTLEDERDGNTYTIAKLADGKYWMTTNLDLTVGTTLNASDSNVPSDGYYTVPNDSSFSDTDTGFAINTGGTDCTSSSTIGCYSYYSWIAATAGGKDASGNSVTSDGGKAAYSICPKGWRLPTATTDGVARDSGGYTGGDFYKMVLAMTGQSSLADGHYENTANFYNAAGPNTTANFPVSGYCRIGSPRGVGSYGNFWSATSSSDTNAYRLRFDSSDVRSADDIYRYSGSSVRCVFGS